MDVNDIVLEFVECSRVGVKHDEITDDKEHQIKRIYDECLSSILKEFSDEIIPELIICNSFNKYSAILPVRINQDNYKYYLLYDCYLNRINQQLDSIFFSENNSEHDIWKLSYELFAEDAFLNKDTVLYTYFGLNKIALGPFEINGINDTILDFVLEVQERYIIAHEIGHWIYKNSVNPNKNCVFNIKFDGNQSVLLNDIKKLLCELYLEYEKKFQDKEYFTILKEQGDIIRGNNNSIHEECFADAIAYAMVFSYVESQYPNDINIKVLAGQALFIELLNLQLLAMQHMTTSEVSFESSTSIRLGFLKNYAVLYFEKAEDLYDDMLKETINRYEKRITNIILECFATLEDRADNIYDGLIDTDKAIDMSKILGLSDNYTNSDLI